jgi:drug/metabolite transporter (DMT)-like permease
MVGSPIESVRDRGTALRGLRWRRGAPACFGRAMNNVLLYLATVAIWGSSWLAITYQLGVVAPEVSILYRFVLSAALLLGWCVLRRLPLRFTAYEHLFMALQGVLLFSINYIIFYFATFYLTSGLVAVAFSTIVIMNIAFGALLLNAPIRPRVALGAVIGLGGLALVFWPDLATFDTGSAGLTGLGLSLLATLSASLGNLTSARNQRAGIPVIQGNAFGMAYGAAFTLAAALVRGVPFAFDLSPSYVLSLFYLALFASVFGFGCYLTLLGRIGPDRAAYASVMFPVVALGLSTVFEGFQWTDLAVAGVALIVLGNIVVLTRFGVPPRAAPTRSRA